MVARIILAVVEGGRQQQARDSTGLAGENSKLRQRGWDLVADVKFIITKMSILPLIRGLERIREVELLHFWCFYTN